MVEYVQKRCRSLTKAQRQQLAVTMDDIIFVLPEDVSVVFDQYGEFFGLFFLVVFIPSLSEGADFGTRVERCILSGPPSGS